MIVSFANLLVILILHKNTECKKLSVLSKEHLILSKFIKGSNIFPFSSYGKEKKEKDLVFIASYFPIGEKRSDKVTFIANIPLIFKELKKCY